MDTKEYIVLYTHQKTKKSKKWQDGKLKITQNGKIELFDDSNNKVETVYVKAGQIQVGEELESDRHLITIEEATSKSSDVNRVDQESTRLISEEKNERIQPVCRQPLRKRRMGFTIPRQMNQPKVTAGNERDINLQCNQTSVESHLNSGSRESLPQSFEMRTSILSSPLFSSKPHQRQTSSFKVFHQDCNGNDQKETSTGHDLLERNTGHDLLQRTVGHGALKQTAGHDPLQRNMGHDPPNRTAGHDPLERNTGHDLLQRTVGHGALKRTAGHDPLQRNIGHDPLNRTAGHDPLQRNTGHDPLNRTDHLSNQSQFQGNIFSRKQDASSEVRAQGFRDEVIESDNGRGAAHTGGKRSASQILALLGKKKSNFQPPLKRTRLDSGSVGINDDYEVRVTCFTRPDCYQAESDVLKEENEVYRGGSNAQEEGSSWTEERSRQNLQQQGQQVTGMSENCNLHAATSVMNKNIMLFTPKTIETKTYFQKDCLKVGKHSAQSHETYHQGNNEKHSKDEESHTGVEKKEEFEDEGVSRKNSSKGCMEVTAHSRGQTGTVINEPNSFTKVSSSCGMAYIHRTKEGDRCRDIGVTVKVKKWTEKHEGENILKGNGVTLLNESSEVKQEFASITNDCLKDGSNGKKRETHKTLDAEAGMVAVLMGNEMPQELISFDMMKEDANETRSGSGEVNGKSETVDVCNAKGRGKSLGRNNSRDDVTAVKNRQSIPFDVMEDDASRCSNESSVRNEEESAMSETVDECSTKRRGQSVGRNDAGDDVIALVNGWLMPFDVMEDVSRCNNESRVRNEDGSGMNEAADECNTKRRGQSVGRNDAGDDVIDLDKEQLIHFDVMKEDANESGARNEEGSGVYETADEYNIKGRGHSVGSEDARDDVVAGGNGQLRGSNHCDTRLAIEASDFSDGNGGGCGKRLDMAYPDEDAVDEISGKASTIPDSTGNIQARNITKDLTNMACCDSSTSRVNVDSDEKVRVSFDAMAADSKDGITGSFHVSHGNNALYLDERGWDVSISGADQGDGFNDGNKEDWFIDASALSFETDCLISAISTSREAGDLVGNKGCPSPNSGAKSDNDMLHINSIDNINPLEVKDDEVPESLPSVFVTQSTVDSEEGEDLPIPVSSEEEGNVPNLLERGEVYSQSEEGKTKTESSKGTVQHNRGTGQLKFDINCEKGCNVNDASEEAISFEDDGRHEDQTIDNHNSRNDELENLQFGIGNTTKRGRVVPPSLARSKLSQGWEESPSDGVNTNSQNSLLSVTTTDTLESSFASSQQNFSGLQTVTEGAKSRTTAGKKAAFCSRDKISCEPGQDGELLNHEDGNSLTNTSKYSALKKSEGLAEVEDSAEHVLEMLQACPDRRDSSEMPVSTTSSHPQVPNQRNKFSHNDGVPQMTETIGCNPCKPVSREVWLPSSPKLPLLSDFLGRSVVSSEDNNFDDCQPSQMPPCISNSSKETLSHEKRDGDAFSSHQLKKELGSSSALQKAPSSLPESASNIHLHKKSQTRYWYQPLASSVVRRRPPSPTVTFASTRRTDFPMSDIRSPSEGNGEVHFLRQDEDEKVMLHHDSLNPPEWNFGINEVENQRSKISWGMDKEMDTAWILGDNEVHRRGKGQCLSELHDGKEEDNSLLSREHADVRDQLEKNITLTNRRNESTFQILNEENWDDSEAVPSGMATQPRSSLPSCFMTPATSHPDVSGTPTLQSHRDLLQELDRDSFAVPNNDDMMIWGEVDYFHPESPVLPLFADVRNTCQNNILSNSSPFQKVPSSSQEYLSPLVAKTELFFQDANTAKEKEMCSGCVRTAKDLPSSNTVFHEMFGSETLNSYQPVSKSLLSCRQDYLINEQEGNALQQSREHLPQLGAVHQIKMQEPQNESVTDCKNENTSWSCDHEEPIRSDDRNVLENSRGFLEEETDVPVVDLSQEVDEIDSQMDLFMSQRDEDEHKQEDSVRKDEENQDVTADVEPKVMSESLYSSSLTQTAKGKKRPLVAIATEDYQSSQLFVRKDDVTVAETDKVHEYSQGLTGREESCFSFGNHSITKPTVIKTSECSVDVPLNKLENHPLHWNKSSTQKHSGHMTGRRRPLHQMQTSFQFPSLCSAVSSQSGKFQTPTMKKLHQTSSAEGRNLSGDLIFPSLEDASSAVVPQRQVTIPTVFQDAASYKQVLTAVLREHLNIILFEVAHTFFTALSKVDVSTYSSTKSVTKGIEIHNPPCQHKQQSKKVCVKKEGPNKGRFFFTCSNARGSQCKFFQWADQRTQGSSKGQQNRPEKEVLSDAKSIEMYVKSFGISLYCECQLVRKSPFSDNIPGAPAWIKKYRQQKVNNERKKLYLRLSRKESSSMYGKDDLWVISKDLRFDSGQSFLVKSVFHGPNSSSELEIEPLGGYSPSNWPSEAIVHAIRAYNASTELSCLSNIKEFVNPRILPILPALLKRDHSSHPVIQSQTSFKSPAIAPSSGRKLHCSDDQIRLLADLVVAKYSLNEDQAKALRGVAEMLTTEETDVPPVTLIHGVFGAGKSYLLAVMVLFLTQLFQLHQEGGGDPNDWKVLISSTTNVAVDRILLSLLELGFEEFIRVGSIRKIAKPVLPYSVHASDKSNQELKELQEMLRGDLSSAEKNFVRKSIERQRLGLNKKMLSKVLVVGVTCAACTFPCIHNLKFPVVLLDECSQITEPACLLPVARFECQKLVLVGDPKQLDPTIQGSEATHDTSLEQTLFDRLLLMGYEPTLLRTQYRCHPRISAIANELFYENKLLDGVTEEQRLELAEGFPTLCFFNVANGKECCTTGGSYLNDREGAFVVTMIEMLVGTGVEPSQIGVITLYKAQVAHVTVLLQQSRLASLKEIKAIQISTVDAFQGGEKDIIILSCVRTDFMGFAASDKRTNVALTRSRNHLLIVGNQKILSANSLWKRVIAKCRECKNGIQDSAAVLKEWAPKLAEIRLAEQEKKQSKRKKPKKSSDAQNTVLTIQSECATSPPLSLESTVSVDEQDQSVPEVISISTPGNSFQEQPSDFKSCNSICDTESTQQIHLQRELFCADKVKSLPSNGQKKHHLKQVQSDQLDSRTVEIGTVDNFRPNLHMEKGYISEEFRENHSAKDEDSHQSFSEVSNQKEITDEVSKPAEMTVYNHDREASKIPGSKDMLEASLNDSPSYSPLEDSALIDSDDSENGLPNFDFDFEV